MESLLPCRTEESFTGQNVEHAKKQYMADRDQVIWQTEVDNLQKCFSAKLQSEKISQNFMPIDPALEISSITKRKSEGELSQKISVVQWYHSPVFTTISRR